MSDDHLARFDKYETKGLLDGSIFDLRVLNKLFIDRLNLLSETKDLTDTEFNRFIDTVDPRKIKEDHYSESLSRNLSLTEKLSIIAVTFIEKILDKLISDYENFSADSFTDFFCDYNIVMNIKSTIDQVKLAEHLTKQKNNPENYYAKLLNYLAAEINDHPAAKTYRKFDAARRGPRTYYITGVLTEIVQDYFQTHEKRIPLSLAIQQIKNSHSGPNQLIADIDDIDEEEKTLTYYPKRYDPNDSTLGTKTIKFSSVNNRLSKIYKKITS